MAAAAPSRVGLLYDERMCAHATPDGEDHPENPERLRAIWRKLDAEGVASRCVVLKAKEAEDKYISSVHSPNHIKLMKEISSNKYDSRRNKIARKYNSIYFNKGSSESAVLAAGSVIEVAEKVAAGELSSAIALVRPPGHHAEHDEAMGFCLFNNVAVAANYLLNERPDLGIKKILIVDWDVHHGNGTQKMFYNDPRVLFFSVHRFDYGSFYPAQGDASHCFIGEDAGKGYNINVPWEHARCGDADYIAAWDHVLLPVTKAFDPDIILVSAGFDAALGDPLGGCCITPNGYALLLTKLLGFAKGRIVMALEGGYNLRSIANSVFACAKVLLGDKFKFSSPEMQPFESTWRIIQAVRNELKRYWPVLSSKLPENESLRTKPSPSEIESVSKTKEAVIGETLITEPALVPSPSQPCQFDEVNLKQAQDSIDSSLFDFAIGNLDDDEVQSSNQEGELATSTILPSDKGSSALSTDVKNQLYDMQVFLQQDIGVLVQNADPIRTLLHRLRAHLPEAVQAALVPAAYIDCYQMRFNLAHQRIADRISQVKEVEEKKALANNTKNRIDFLESNRPSMVKNIDRLKVRRADLMKELKLVTDELETEEKKLRELPQTIEDLKKTLKLQASDAVKLHKKAKRISCSIEDAQRIIDEIDQIRQRAVQAMQTLLQLKAKTRSSSI